MESSAAFTGLKPNYLLCPSRHSSIFSTSFDTRPSSSFSFSVKLQKHLHFASSKSHLPAEAIVSDSYSATAELANIDLDNLGFGVWYGNGVGVVSEKLYSELTRLQMGVIEDKMDWTVELAFEMSSPMNLIFFSQYWKRKDTLITIIDRCHRGWLTPKQKLPTFPRPGSTSSLQISVKSE